MKLFICCISLLCITLNCNAQKVSSLREEYINTVLSDTVGFGYILILPIVLKGNDTVKIYFTPNQMLYLYFKKRYNWDGVQYIDTMKYYLNSGKPMIVDDEDYFDTKDLLPISSCNNKYNYNRDSLIKAFQSSSSNYSLCLLLQCFSKNILLIWAETETGTKIGIARFPIPKDIDPFTGVRLKNSK